VGYATSLGTHQINMENIVINAKNIVIQKMNVEPNKKSFI